MTYGSVDKNVIEACRNLTSISMRNKGSVFAASLQNVITVSNKNWLYNKIIPLSGEGVMTWNGRKERQEKEVGGGDWWWWVLGIGGAGPCLSLRGSQESWGWSGALCSLLGSPSTSRCLELPCDADSQWGSEPWFQWDCNIQCQTPFLPTAWMLTMVPWRILPLSSSP